jgi:hypothetical protein
MFSFFTLQKNNNKFLRGGCLSESDTHRIYELQNSQDPLLASKKTILKRLLRLRKESEDNLRKVLYDRRIQELLWREFNPTLRKNYPNQAYKNLKSQNVNLTRNIDLTYCHNSEIIHHPELYAENPRTFLCEKVISKCFSDDMEKERYVNINSQPPEKLMSSSSSGGGGGGGGKSPEYPSGRSSPTQQLGGRLSPKLFL